LIKNKNLFAIISIIYIAITNALANPNKYDRDKVIDPSAKHPQLELGIILFQLIQ